MAKNNKKNTSRVEAIVQNRVFVSIVAILIGLIVGAIVIGISGSNPLKAYYNILQGCGIAPKANYGGKKGMITDFMDYIDFLTPALLAALSFSVAMKAGLFNIGISGQMMISAFIATITVGYSTLPAAIAKPLVIIIGLTVGALVGSLVGWLRFKFNINEVVSTIMINYIFRYVITFFINMYYVDPVSRQSKLVTPESRLSLQKVPVGDYKMTIPLGIIVALLAVVFVYIFMEKTKTGFEIKAVGSSPSAAKYTGINVGRNMILSMAVSGGLAGLAGVTCFMGYNGSIQPGVLPSLGFDAIAVALLGNNNPFGIIASTMFISALGNGSAYMTSSSGVETEICEVITGVILVFSACATYITYLINRRINDKKAKEEA